MNEPTRVLSCLLAASVSVSACVRGAPGPRGAPEPLVVPPLPPAAPDREEAAADEPTPPAKATLAWHWGAPPRGFASLRFDEEISAARVLGTRFAAHLTLPVAQGEETRQAYSLEEGHLEQLVRAYARASHARDATARQKLLAMSEAAGAMEAWTRALARAGLSRLPREWRIAAPLLVSPEDVTTGPVARWRREIRALTERCAALAHAGALHLEVPAVECDDIRNRSGGP